MQSQAFESETLTSVIPDNRLYWPSISWAAIFAGLTTAIAFQVVFVLCGAALGFALYSPLTDASPGANLGRGAVLIQGLSAVFSLWFGGWVAGRLTPVGLRLHGGIHGLLLWCTATVAGVIIVSTGAGWAMGDISKVVGGGLALAGKPAAAVASSAGDAAKDGLKQSTSTIGSFVDESVSRMPGSATASETIRAKREIGLAVARLFDPAQHDLPANRQAAVQALAQYSGMSAADADRTVTDWTNSYEQLQAELRTAKEEAEMKAREAANEAAKALAIFSACAVVGLGLGVLAACAGGRHGAASALAAAAR